MQRTLHTVLLLLGTAGLAGAAPQLDLPKERKRPPREQADSKKEAKPGAGAQGDIAGRATTDSSKTEQLLDKNGRPIGEVTTRKINTPGRRQSNGSQKLSLPRKRIGATPPSDGGAPATSSAAAPPTESGRQGVQPSSAGAEFGGQDDPSRIGPADFPSTRNSARFLYEQLTKARRAADPEVAEAADRLARLGDDGIEVARYALRQDDAVLAYAGARALLAAGTAEDADDVVRILRGALPDNVGLLILEELVERDPVRANERLLVDLLRHDNSPLRRSAKRHLRPMLDSDEADLLVPALGDRASDVRRAAAELLAGLDGPLPTELLIDCVTDRSSAVSLIAIKALKNNESEAVDFELLRRAMESGEILRREALLLIAIVEREDRLVRPILGPQHAVPLVSALSSTQPLVQSSAAVALAGIGFRSAETESTEWLDGAVPSTLIGVAAGFTFFDGFEIVRDPALRRLRQITGVSHGSNGPAWARWWSANKAGFRASRAVIDVTTEDEQRIIVAVEDLTVGRPFALVGPALAADEEWIAADPSTFAGYELLQRRGDVIFLTTADAIELAALLREEGVFGAERLPGPRGAIGSNGRTLDVAVGGRGKNFRFGGSRTAPWFDRVLVRAHGLSDRNAWQRYPVEGEHPSQRELFLAEASWWSEPREQVERDARLKGLLIRHLVAAAPADRGPAIDELERLSASEGGALAVDDIPVLLDLLVQEPRFNKRSRSLVGLLRESAAAGTVELSRATATQIVVTLHDRFGPAALPAMRTVIAGQGRDAVLAAAVDERGLVRVAAADALAEGDDEQDIDLLIGLLGDRDEDVRIAAISGLGSRSAIRARDKIIALADSSKPRIRVAALRAAGGIGGSGAIDVLVRGLTDPDERYHLPAAEGLANIEQVEAAPLLVSLLRGNARTSVRDQARDGLMRLGERAHTELFSAMRSPDNDLRREAALILAKQLEPRSVNVLARTLAENPEDEVVGEELVVLTCVDYRKEKLPADRWFQWWDEVDRRDPFSWFLAALERRNLRAPAREAFELGGTTEARVFLLSIISELKDPLLAERALRELERLHGAKLGPLPLEVSRRAEWLAATRAMVAPEDTGGSSR